MTEKMNIMFKDVMAALFTLPEEHVEYCFGECYPIHPVEFGEYILLEFIKNAYYESMEKHPLRYYFPYSTTDNDHSERMRYARALKYTQKYKDKNYEMLAEEVNYDPERMKEHEALKTKDMSDMEKRIEGYELTEMEVFEHTNIIELQIIKAIVEDRISSSKKISNDRFVEMFQEYDAWVERLIQRSKQSDEDMMFASMAFFTLEWKYDIELIYLIAEYMEKEGLEEVDFLSFWALGLMMNFDSRLGNSVVVDNRMIKERQVLVSDFFGGDSGEIEWYRTKYVEILGIVCIFLNMDSTEENLSYMDWFRVNTSMKDWASFMRDYDVFTAWHPKVWTNRKIKNARKLLRWVCPFRGDKPK